MSVVVASYVQLHSNILEPDPSRVVPRLVVPFEDRPTSHQRTEELVSRLKALSVDETETLIEDVLARFSPNHVDLNETLVAHARIVDSILEEHSYRDNNQELLVGAAFTAEYAPEAVAVCNPSAVRHPDQKNLPPGSLRIAMSARAIGEGHISSICFYEAIVTAEAWTFVPPTEQLSLGTIEDGRSRRELLDLVVDGYHRRADMATTIGGEKQALLARNSLVDEEIEAFREWRRHALAQDSRVARSHAEDRLYTARFSPTTDLDQRILLPEANDEAHGLEDLRLVEFIAPDGSTEYRGCYTAFDGKMAVPQLMTSGNLREFEIHSLTGPATADKGLALFPRTINGQHLAITRADWQNIALARSDDGYFWKTSDVLYRPQQPWEIVKTGNCGSPIELDEGWLVITHGVGTMRRYSFGALLLDKTNPDRVLATLTSPLITTEGSQNDGYVPNAIYSCGGLLYDGTLWLPFSESDKRVRIASIPIQELLSNMTPIS